MTISELIMAFNVRQVENNIHPNSAFKKSIDKEMIAIKDQIKKIKASPEAQKTHEQKQK